MSNSQADERKVTQPMRPNIRITHALNGRVKDYAAEHDLTTSEAYQRVIEAGLETVERNEERNEDGGADDDGAADDLDLEELVAAVDWSAGNYASTPARVEAVAAALQVVREQNTTTTPTLVAILDEHLGDGSNNQRMLSDVAKQLDVVESPPSGSNLYRWVGRD